MAIPPKPWGCQRLVLHGQVQIKPRILSAVSWVFPSFLILMIFKIRGLLAEREVSVTTADDCQGRNIRRRGPLSHFRDPDRMNKVYATRWISPPFRGFGPLQKRGPCHFRHGPAIFLMLRQPGCPQGTVAFRPRCSWFGFIELLLESTFQL